MRQESRRAPTEVIDARVARTRTNVVRAATDLLCEGGPSAVTVDAIVARSGVAKSTIYRHWETRDDVLVSVIEHAAPQIEAPDATLGFEAALRALMAALCRTFNDPDWARVMPALLTLRTHQDGVADIEQRLEARQERAIDVVLRRGVAEGRLGPDFDLDEASALLVGPLTFALLTGKPAIDERFCSGVVDSFLRSHVSGAMTS